MSQVLMASQDKDRKNLAQDGAASSETDNEDYPYSNPNDFSFLNRESEN